MKRSIFILFCAVAVGGAACEKVPQATSPSSSPTPAATATPTPVGERLDPLKKEPRQAPSPSTRQQMPPPVPGAGQHTPSTDGPAAPPHRKPPVSAKMEV